MADKEQGKDAMAALQRTPVDPHSCEKPVLVTILNANGLVSDVYKVNEIPQNPPHAVLLTARYSPTQKSPTYNLPGMHE